MRVTFPHLGNAYIALEPLLFGLGHEVVTPPPNSKFTLELGAKMSPEQICLPFKIIMGNMVEGLRLGADTIFMIGGWGPCCLGYYGEIQRILLGTISEDIEFITLEVPRKYRNAGHVLKQVFRPAGIGALRKNFFLAWAKLKALENLEQLALVSRPRELEKDSTSRALTEALINLRAAQTMEEIRNVVAESREKLLAPISLMSEKEVLRVGLVGEIYTVLEPLANFDLERSLGRLGVEVLRTISLSNWVYDHIFLKMLGRSHLRVLKQSAQGYLHSFVGGHGLETVARSVDLAKERVDGIIQILPLHCTPEILAQGILPRISRDYHIPIMSLVIDEHVGETGFQTRLEAFVDLLERRKSVHV